jgi:hypothetical protein
MQLLPVTPIPAASTGNLSGIIDITPTALTNLLLEAQFVAGSGGTSVDAYVQTSIDDGVTWVDIRNFHFTTSSLKQVVNHSSATPVTTALTPTDGSLSNNTSNDGIIGNKLRVKYNVVGTYTGATLGIWANGVNNSANT